MTIAQEFLAWWIRNEDPTLWGEDVIQRFSDDTQATFECVVIWDIPYPRSSPQYVEKVYKFSDNSYASVMFRYYSDIDVDCNADVFVVEPYEETVIKYKKVK